MPLRRAYSSLSKYFDMWRGGLVPKELLRCTVIEKLKPLDLGLMPVDSLKKIGIAAVVGRVIFSIAAQKHAIKRHAAEFERCRPYLPLAVNYPTHVGQAPHHKGIGCELIYEHVAHGLIVLVAVHLEVLNANGTYIVKSAYPIDRGTLDRRIRKGYVIATK